MSIRIAVDVDEVLCPFLRTMSRWRYPRFVPPSRFPYDYKSLFELSTKETRALVDTFYFTKDFSEMKPFPESQVHLKHLRGQGYEIYAVSERRYLSRYLTEDWLDYYYPKTFRDLFLTEDKAGVCSSANMGFIIDDDYQVCMESLEKGIHPINFVGDPLYPWCTMNEHAEKNWQGVYQNILDNTPKSCKI